MLPLHQSSITAWLIHLWLNHKKQNTYFLNLVGAKRLELLHLAALEPKSSASTNFATPPMDVYISDKLSCWQVLFIKKTCIWKLMLFSYTNKKCRNKKRNFKQSSFLYLAEDQGLEPWRTVLETVMLPLHQSSITAWLTHLWLNHKKSKILLLLKFGGGEETRTLTPCGAGT